MPAANEGVTVAWAGVTVDCRDPERVAAFWAALLGTTAHPVGEGREGWCRVGPVVAGGPVLNFQPVAEPREGKVRLHLDLWVDRLEPAIATAEALGARRAGELEVVPGRGTIAVMADPEGHEFCLISSENAS